VNAIAKADDNFSDALRMALANGTVQPSQDEVSHVTTDNLYGRWFKAPRGTVISTRVHKEDHISVMLKGEILVVDQDGNKSILTAPAVFVTKAGTKRAIYVKEDFEFLTVHHLKHANLDTVKDDLTCDSLKEYRQLVYGGGH